MARLISILLAIAVVLALAGYLLLSFFLDKERVVELAATAVKEETGATLSVDGDLSLSFFPILGVAFSDASLTMPERTQPDLEIGSAQIGVRLAPLFSGQVEVDSISVDGLTARLVASVEQERVDTSGFSDEELEAYYQQRRSARQQAGDAAGAEAALAVPLALSVSQLTVSNARVETLDPATDTVSVVELATLQAQGLNLSGEPIPVVLRISVPGETPIRVNLEGDLQLDQAAETVRFSALDISVDGVTAATLEVTATGSAHLSRQTADLTLQIGVGELEGDGSVRYAAFESPQVDADLTLNKLDPVLLALAGPEAAADTPPAASGDEPLPLDALRAVDTRASLRVASAQFDAYELTDLIAELRAVEGVVKLSRLTAGIYGGELDATAILNGRHNTATLETQGSVENVDLAALLTAAQAPASVSGAASLNWQLESRGRTANDLTAALQGPLQLNTRDIVLHGTSVERMLCNAVALTNQEALTATFSTDTRFTDVSATVQVNEGRANLRPLRANLEHVSLSGTGDLDLLKQDFEATFKGRLSPGLEELDRACRVSKRLTAIDFPVDCRGNLAGAPGDWCKVDTEEIIRDLAVNEGRRALEKEAGKLLNRLFGGNKSSEEE